MASIPVKAIAKPGIFSRISSVFGRSKQKFSFEYQFSCADRAIEDSLALQTLPLHKIPSQLLNVTNELKPKLNNINDQPLVVKLSLIDDILAKSISSLNDTIPETFSFPPNETVPEEKKEIKQLYYRLSFSRNYFKSLNQAIKNGTLQSVPVERKLISLLDSTLIGTSSERVSEHLLLYGPQLHQDTLQFAFYTLYEPEVQTTVSILNLYPFQRQKKQLKINNKLASTYLLDKLELNTKTRSVFAWSDPNYTGFKPLPDDFQMPTVELIRGRKSFFPEGDYVAKTFLESVKAHLREEENNHIENRDNMRNGTYFFIATCILDWIICTV